MAFTKKLTFLGDIFVVKMFVDDITKKIYGMKIIECKIIIKSFVYKCSIIKIKKKVYLGHKKYLYLKHIWINGTKTILDI